MQDKQATRFILEVFIIIVILGLLAAIAVPSVSRMFHNGKEKENEAELKMLESAVSRMLSDSITGTLEPFGPTADMRSVRTTDTPPLVLADYIEGLAGGFLESGNTYLFGADGRVTAAPGSTSFSPRTAPAVVAA